MFTMFIGNLLLLSNLTIFANKLLQPKIKNKYVVISVILISSLILSSKSYPFLEEIGSYIMASFYIIYTLFLFWKSNKKNIYCFLIYGFCFIIWSSMF